MTITKCTVLLGFLLTGMVGSVFSSTTNMFRKVSDFDGDGRADFAITRNLPEGKFWYVWQTTGGFRVFRWGISSDSAAAGDYDGDGKTDFAVFRDSTSFPIVYRYHILHSSTGVYDQKSFSAFSNMGSYQAHQDYNGDGRVDAGLNFGEFTLSTQLEVQYSVVGGGASYSVPGQNTAVRMGDVTGDGRADSSFSNFSTAVLGITSSQDGLNRYYSFGVPGDRRVMADFDGDAIGDLAVYRPSTGTWWWVRSSDGQPNAYQWGNSTDIPVPADYDGDGKTDIAIWRPGSQSAYWVVGSQGGTFVVPWGISSDNPVTY